MKNVEYAIIGNSTAAIGAIEGIRSVDTTGDIAVVSKESYHTYSRPLISHFLSGEIEEDRIYYRPENFYKENKVVFMPGAEVVGIDTSTRKLMAEGGREIISYRKLLIAAGGKPFIPDIKGLETKGVFTFTSLDDAKALNNFVKEKLACRSKVKAVVIGGGLIGIKCAEALRAMGSSVLIVELANRVLPLALDEYASSLAGDALKEAGIEIACNVAVETILSDSGSACGVVLNTGGKEPCDLVVVATGVVPATNFLSGSTIETDRGVLIDHQGRTSVSGVFAAGDIAQAQDSLMEMSRVIPIFPNAFRQGQTAGINMAGGKTAITSNIAMNSVSICGLPTISAGLSTSNATSGLSVIEKKASGRVYKKIVIRNGRVVGALFTGDISRAGIIIGMIRQNVDVAGIENLLLTDEFGVISLPGEYRKHLVRGEGMEV